MVGVGLEDLAQARADERLVVHQQDSDGHPVPPTGSRARTAYPPSGRGPAVSSPP